ncbi:hypothetical protein ABZ442_00760 [Streptomyces triculaminicus]|uniref:hypothetical protein n=1 Tax=Streptomyces triculaminicus TaxID=2816232 RepID=UPI0033E1B068
MQKISTLFVRDPDDRRYVLPEVTPGCEWVIAGEGIPTRKYDGTCVMLDGTGEWWARREVKPRRTPPPGYLAVETDEVTGKTVGWEPIAQSSFAKFHAEALATLAAEAAGTLAPGTYELVGPKVNGNPERKEQHELIAHGGAAQCDIPERSFTVIRDRVLAFHASDGCEGVVFHHPDGRMAKIKARDFRSGN